MIRTKIQSSECLTAVHRRCGIGKTAHPQTNRHSDRQTAGHTQKRNDKKKKKKKKKKKSNKQIQ